MESEETSRDGIQIEYRYLLEALGDPLVAADSSNSIVYVNRAAESLLGWPAGELVGEPLTVIQPPRLRAAHLAGFRRYLETGTSTIIGRPVRVPALHRDGSEIDIELTIGALPLDGDTLFVASLRDLGERIELERHLSLTRYLRASTRAAARLTSLLDFDAVVSTTLETLVNDFDAALVRIWLVEPGSRTLYLQGQAGPASVPSVPESDQIHYAALPLWIERVIRARVPFVQNDLTGDRRFDQEWVAREGITSVAAFPLLIGEDVRGVVVLFSRFPLPEELIDVLTGFAAIVSASINDVQLFVREQEARGDAEAARARSDFLAQASQVLAGSLDYEQTLRNLAHLIVPFLADWCVVDMLDSNGHLARLEVAHADPDRLELVREFQRRFPPESDASQSALRVIETGRAEVVREITDEMLERGARDAEHLDLIHRLELRSYMCVPLTAHGRTRGAITLMGAESGRRFGLADLALAEDLARRAAIAVDNACLYQELREAITIRDEFLASVSHDLKNPIASIKGRAQMLQRRSAILPEVEAERFGRGLAGIDASATRMSTLIDDLVDVARLRIGQPLALHTAPTDLVGLVRQVVSEQQPDAGDHEIRVETAVDTLIGQWDATRLVRVVANLLSNAIKYSPERGVITVEVSRVESGEGPVAVVIVRDQGIGIPSADLPHIFDRFHRGANVVGTFEGTGIGLATAKQIVEQHGGRILVESDEGEGATFTVELPLSSGDRPPSTDQVAQPE